MTSHRHDDQRPAKRARAEGLSDAPHAGASGATPSSPRALQPALSRKGWRQLEADLEMLPDAVAKEILVQYAPMLPGLALGVIDRCDELRLQEARTKRNYDSCANETDYLMNAKYNRRMRSGEEWEAALDVETEIGKMFEKMDSEIKPYSSFFSKHNALKNMLQMFESVMQCGDDNIGDIVGRSHRCSRWEDLFLRVLGRLTPDELARLGEPKVKLVWKLDIVVGYADSYGLFGRIRDAYDILNPEVVVLSD